MKKLLPYLLIFSLTITFNSCKKEGCTDSQATNYDADATKDDESCMYDITGIWNVTGLQVNGTESISDFDLYRITLNPNGTYLSEAEYTSGEYADVEGSWEITGSNSSSITLQNSYLNYYDGNGWIEDYSWSTFTISALNANSATLNLTASNNSSINSMRINLSKL